MVKHIKNNKKGIAFFSLMAVFILVLFFIFNLRINFPMGSADKKTDIKENILTFDILVSNSSAETFFIKKEVSRITTISKNNFISSLGANTNQMLERSENDLEKLITCRLDNKNLWYNQINEDYNNKEENVKKYSNCLPEFLGNINEKFTQHIEKQIKESFKDNNYQIEVKEHENKININIKKDIEISTDTISSTYTFNYENSNDFSQYLLDISALTQAISKIPSDFKTSIPKCIREDNKNELECMEKRLKEIISENSPLFFENNDISMTFIDEISKKTKTEYFGLDIKIKGKKSIKDELSFAIILKDNIPLADVSFELSNSLNLDDTINVKITKPLKNDKISQYAIFYSTENFLSKNNQYNEKFIDLLKKSQIPSSYTDTGYIDSQKNRYFYSDDLKGINLILSSNDNFIELDSQAYKNINLYQFYDSSKTYSRFDSSTVYVYVFAVDDKYNYFVEDIDKKGKTIQTTKVLGPTPPTENEQNTITGNIYNFEKSLWVKLRDYNANDFSYFDIYIIDKSAKGEFKPYCIEASNCHYYSGKNKIKLDDEKNLNIIITSDKNHNAFQGATFLYSELFSNSLNLENDKLYDVILVSYNIADKGIISTTRIDKYFEIIQNQDLTIYKIVESSPFDIKPFRINNIKISANKAPSSDSYSILEPNYKITGNKIYLQWTSNENENIAKLIINGRIIKDDGSTTPIAKTITSTTQICDFEENIEKIMIDNIIPVNSKGLKNDNLQIQNPIIISTK